MFWIFPALASHFFWALVNIGDKYIVGNRVKNPYVYLMWLNMIGILALALIPFVDFYMPEPRLLLWIALAGALWFFGGCENVDAVEISRATARNNCLGQVMRTSSRIRDLRRTSRYTTRL